MLGAAFWVRVLLFIFESQKLFAIKPSAGPDKVLTLTYLFSQELVVKGKLGCKITHIQ